MDDLDSKPCCSPNLRAITSARRYTIWKSCTNTERSKRSVPIGYWWSGRLYFIPRDKYRWAINWSCDSSRKVNLGSGRSLRQRNELPKPTQSCETRRKQRVCAGHAVLDSKPYCTWEQRWVVHCVNTDRSHRTIFGETKTSAAYYGLQHKSSNREIMQLIARSYRLQSPSLH